MRLLRRGELTVRRGRRLCLVHCAMEETDLAFGKSDVTATVTTPIVSVKDPRSGLIAAPAVGAFVWDDPDARGLVVTGGTLCRALSLV